MQILKEITNFCNQIRLQIFSQFNKIYIIKMFPSQHHKHHHHHHGHHGHHNSDPKVVVVVQKKPNHALNIAQEVVGAIALNQVIKHANHGMSSSQGYSNQGFNNNSNQGFNNMGQGFNNMNTSGQGFNMNQGFNNMNQGFNNMNQGFNNMNQGSYSPNLNLFNPNQEYIIESGVGHHMVLDVCQHKNRFGELIIHPKTGKLNQRFRIVPHNNRYIIVSCSATNVVTVQNNSAEKGQHLHTHFNADANGQLWQFAFVKDKPNSFYIHNGFNMYMDVYRGKHSEGTPIIQWKFNGNKNQIWTIVPVI